MKYKLFKQLFTHLLFYSHLVSDSLALLHFPDFSQLLVWLVHFGSSLQSFFENLTSFLVSQFGLIFDWVAGVFVFQTPVFSLLNQLGQHSQVELVYDFGRQVHPLVRVHDPDLYQVEGLESML
jgi:hypothetical protein